MPLDSEDYEQAISFASQQAGVASAAEFAAERAESTLAEVETQVPANSQVVVQDAQNQVSLPAVLESLSMYSISPHEEETFVELQVDANGDGTVDSTPLITPRVGSESFDPGALAPQTAIVDIRLVNDSANQTTMGAQALFREL